VLFDDLGWVAFDPLPKSKDPRPVEEDFTPKPPTPPPSTSEAPPSDSASASAPAAVLAAAPDAGLPTVVVAGGASGSALLVLVALAGSVVVLRRGLRRRRLAVGGPDERITGAWLEFTDALRLAGRPVPAHLAATEAAGYAAEEPAPAERKRLLRRAVPRQRAGSGLPDPDAGARPDVLGPDLVVLDAGESEAAWSNAAGPGTGAVAVARAPGTVSVRPLPPLDALVAGVNTVGFAPGHADDEQADRAGAQAVAYADALRAHRSWWRRIWWSVRPGPLRWHR
jgi:hypothetical protein